MAVSELRTSDTSRDPPARRPADPSAQRRTGGRLPIVFLGERGQLNQLLTDDEACAADRADGEPDLAARSDAVTLGHAGAEHGVEERLDLALGDRHRAVER